jgi:predicted nucleic acid-binding protein
MKIGLDSNVLVASVKKVGEPFHDSALELSRRIKDQNGSGIGSALVLIEIPGALASSSTMPIEKIYEVTASVQAVQPKDNGIRQLCGPSKGSHV